MESVVMFMQYGDALEHEMTDAGVVFKLWKDTLKFCQWVLCSLRLYVNSYLVSSIIVFTRNSSVLLPHYLLHLPLLVYIFTTIVVLNNNLHQYIVTLWVMWHHQSCDHYICNNGFLYSQQEQSTIHLVTILNLKDLWWWPWCFGVTWHYWSHGSFTHSL